MKNEKPGHLPSNNPLRVKKPSDWNDPECDKVAMKVTASVRSLLRALLIALETKMTSISISP
jgi:hypothetical protein